MTRAELEDCLYNHVMEKIDFAGIYVLEQMLWYLLPEAKLVADHDDEKLFAVADAMIRQAIIRAASAPTRSFSTVPFGVTNEEVKAVAFDAGCRLCVMERDHERSARQALVEGDEEEVCPCCISLAEDWRAKHADALREAGVVTS